MKKIYLIIVTLTALILILTLNINHNKLENENLKTTLTNLENENKNLKSTITNLEDNASIKTTYDCTYTITLNYEQTLEFKPQDGITKYLIFKEFHGEKPYIFKTTNNTILKKDTYYEIEINGIETVDTDYSTNNIIYEISNITETTKEPFDQIQQTCQKN